MDKNIRLTVILCLVFVALVFALTYHRITRNNAVSLSPEALREVGAMVYETPVALQPFTLVDHRGQAFTQEQLKGHWSLIFFGFTSCPDICPLTLTELSQFYRQLEAESGAADRPQVIMVSVDPARDSTEKMAHYMSSFHEDFVGLNGPYEDVAALARQLFEPIQQALTVLQQGLENQGRFDPRHSARSFKLLMSDAGESALLPALIRRVTATPTTVRFEVMRLPHERYAEALQSGTADLAIGFLPFLKAGFQRARLFADPYRVVARRHHPLTRSPLTLDAFASAQHVSIATGNADLLVDRYLAKHRRKRDVVLKVSHYHVAADVAAGSDLLATVPGMIASVAHDVSVLDLPMKVEPAQVQMVWHRTLDQDPGNAWLREQLAGLEPELKPAHIPPAAESSPVKRPARRRG